MGLKLTRQSGRYVWNAIVACTWPGQPRTTLKLFCFCDTRDEAIDAVCHEAILRGYIHPTVDHITKVA